MLFVAVWQYEFSAQKNAAGCHGRTFGGGFCVVGGFLFDFLYIIRCLLINEIV